MQSQKRQNDLCSFQGKPFNITVIQAFAPTRNAEEAEVEWLYEDLQDLLKLKKRKKLMWISRQEFITTVTQDISQLWGLRGTNYYVQKKKLQGILYGSMKTYKTFLN